MDTADAALSASVLASKKQKVVGAARWDYWCLYLKKASFWFICVVLSYFLRRCVFLFHELFINSLEVFFILGLFSLGF